MTITNVIPKQVRGMHNGYTQESQRATRQGMEALHAHLFLHENRCHLKKNHILEGSAFGFITIENALSDHLLVIDKDTGQATLYATVDDMVNDGWVVD